MAIERFRPHRVVTFRASAFDRKAARPIRPFSRVTSTLILLAAAAGAGGCASTGSNPAALERLQRPVLEDEFVSSDLPKFEPIARQSLAFQGPNGPRQASLSLQTDRAIFDGIPKSCWKLSLEWEKGAYQGGIVEVLFDRDAARARTSIPGLADLPNPAEQITHVCTEFLAYFPDLKPLEEYLKSLGRNASRR